MARRNRCVCPDCKPRNPATACGHWHCGEECSALDVFAAEPRSAPSEGQDTRDEKSGPQNGVWRVDYTRSGFERPEAT